VLRGFAVKEIHREAAKSAKISAKKNPFLPAKDFRVSSIDEHRSAQPHQTDSPQSRREDREKNDK